MKITGPSLFAILLTLAVAGGVAFWAWSGLKSPPVHEPAVSIVTTPSGWKEFDGEAFTLYAPKYAVLRKIGEPGHAVGQLIGLGFYVKYELGARANTLAGPESGTEFSESGATIDRRRAMLRKVTLSEAAGQARFGTYAQPSYIGLYIPEAFRIEQPDCSEELVALQIEGVAQNGDLRDTVEMILKSIRFRPTD